MGGAAWSLLRFYVVRPYSFWVLSTGHRIHSLKTISAFNGALSFVHNLRDMLQLSILFSQQMWSTCPFAQLTFLFFTASQYSLQNFFRCSSDLLYTSCGCLLHLRRVASGCGVATANTWPKIVIKSIQIIASGVGFCAVALKDARTGGMGERIAVLQL